MPEIEYVAVQDFGDFRKGDVVDSIEVVNEAHVVRRTPAAAPGEPEAAPVVVEPEPEHAEPAPEPEPEHEPEPEPVVDDHPHDEHAA